MNKQILLQIIQKIDSFTPKSISALIGFDGFVDEVVHVVDQRIDADHYKRIEYLDHYGKRISAAAGLSLNIEMVPITAKLGGNGPIFANSLSYLGIDICYIGALGKETIHPVFHDFASQNRIFSISDPGYTDAVEFYDGKIIRSKLESLKDVNWNRLKEKMPPAELAQYFDNCRLVGFENWTLLIYMTEIWEGIYHEVFPLMKNDRRKILFLDMADFEKRMRKDVRFAFDYMKKFEEKFEVILGLNEKEAYQAAALFGQSKENLPDLLVLARFLKEQLSISAVVIHPVKTACAASETENHLVSGPYCEKPVLTTGAGDNFNAGFVFGCLIGCTLEEALYLGTANSGFYVRNGYSPNVCEMKEFLRMWAKDSL